MCLFNLVLFIHGRDSVEAEIENVWSWGIGDVMKFREETERVRKEGLVNVLQREMEYL